MHRLFPLFLTSFALLVLAAACGTASQRVTEPEPTQPAIVTSQPAEPAEPEPTPTPEPPRTTAVTRFDVQAVTGPGYRYPTAARFAAGAEVGISGRSRDGLWLLTASAGQPAWIASWALEYDQSETNLLPEAQAAIPAPQDMRREPIPSSPPPLEFGYGLQAHMIGTNIERVAGATRDLGFNWLKQQVRWSITEPEDDAYRWGELDLIVDRTTYSDIYLLFSVVTSPDWARESGFDASVDGPPADTAHLANFLGELASRYCGTSVRAIEVWNEQNLHYEWGNHPLSAEDYVAMLAESSVAIRNACPSMYIVSGALTPSGSVPNIAVDDFVYLEQMLIAGLAQHVDAIGAHPSGYNVPAGTVWQDACAAIVQYGNTFNGACDNPHHSWSFRSTMEGYRLKAQTFGANLPIWPTEFGWAAGGAYHEAYGYANDNSFEEQAAWTVEAFQMMKEWGWVGPPILWNLNFRVIADQTERAQWGIVDNYWQPLPVYNSLKALPK